MADLSPTVANVAKVSGSVKVGTCGTVAITQGAAVYVDPTTGDLELCENDQTAVEANVAGIALNAASPGQPVSYQVSGVINLGATLTLGEVYCIGGGVGAIAPTADIVASEFQSIVGVAITTANLQIGLIVSGVASA